MASLPECECAVQSLVDKLADLDPEVRKKYVVDRTVSCRVTDLDVTWSAHLGDAGIHGLRTGVDAKAQVRLTVASDDLLALIEGRLAVPTAWAVGKLRVQASPLDLLKLRQFL